MIKKIQLTHFEVWKFKIQFLLETPKLDCCIMQQDNDDIDLDGLFGEGGNNKHFNSLLRKALLFQFEKRFAEWI